MSTVQISGSFTSSPPTAGEGGFPSGSTSIDLAFVSGSTGKPAPAQTGVQQRVLASPSAYVTLRGVGTSDAVPRADTLVLRTMVAMLVRFTLYDTSTAIVPVKGLMVVEFDPANALTLVEAKGSGTIEWFASGPAQ